MEHPAEARASSESRLRELVELLFDAARRGEWRAVALMLDRCFGKAREQIAIEREEPEAIKPMRQMSTEDLIALVQARRHLRLAVVFASEPQPCRRAEANGS